MSEENAIPVPPAPVVEAPPVVEAAAEAPPVADAATTTDAVGNADPAGNAEPAADAAGNEAPKKPRGRTRKTNYPKWLGTHHRKKEDPFSEFKAVIDRNTNLIRFTGVDSKGTVDTLVRVTVIEDGNIPVPAPEPGDG